MKSVPVTEVKEGGGTGTRNDGYRNLITTMHAITLVSTGANV